MQLGELVVLTLALQIGHLSLDPVDFFLDVRAALHLGLFRLPDFFEVVVFALEFFQLFLDELQALQGSFVLFLLHRLALDLELDHAPVELVHHLRLGVDFHLDAGGRFVDQVNRLVRQKAVGNVTVRKLRRRDNRRVGNLDTVVQLITLLQPAQNGDGRLNCRLIDLNLLEAALQRGVFFNVLAVFIERRRPDAVHLATRQRRFQHIAGINRALGLAGPDHRVQLVDEHDDAPLVLGDFLQDGLQALLELTAILGPGQQRRHVQ